MPKLKKPRPAPAAPPFPTPVLPVSSSGSSTIKAPSILSNSTTRSSSHPRPSPSSKNASPIALRTKTASPAMATVSSFAAQAELIEGEGGAAGEGTGSDSGGKRSRSPTRSSDAASHRSASPASSLHRPAVDRFFNARRSTSQATLSSYLSNDLPPSASAFANTSDDPLPSTSSAPLNRSASVASIGTGGASTSSSSALAGLRKKLDSDKVAREAQRVREDYAHGGSGGSGLAGAKEGNSTARGTTLRKKLPDRVVQRKLEELHVGTGEAEERKEEEEEEGEREAAEEVALEEEEEDKGRGGVHGARETADTIDELDIAVDPAVVPPNEEANDDSDDEHDLVDQHLIPSSIRTATYLLTSPARFSWNLTASTLNYSLETSKSVLRHVPLAGRLVALPLTPPPPHSSTPSSDYPASAAPYPFAPSDPPSHRRRRRASSSATTSTSLYSTLSTASPSKLACAALETTVGVGVASVLVGVAVGGMVWEKVSGRDLIGGSGRKRERR